MRSTVKITALVLYAGSNTLSDMTVKMLDQLLESIEEARTPTLYASSQVDLHTRVLAICNGSTPFPRRRLHDLKTEMLQIDSNIGFAKGFNAGIRYFLDDRDVPDYWLILNNDLEFPNKGWLRELVNERTIKQVICPTTDRTATSLAVSGEPLDKDPIHTESVSAYAWMVPESIRALIEEKEGFTFFDPDFDSYGEDDWTSLLIQHHVGPKPFRIVPRAWVQHLKARTTAEVKPDRAAASQLLCDKIRTLLQRRRRGDVDKKAQWHLRMLRK